MPLVEITLAQGRTPEQIHALLTAVTHAVHDAIGAPIESIRVVAREIPPTHWAAGGVTLAERAASAAIPTHANSSDTQGETIP